MIVHNKGMLFVQIGRSELLNASCYFEGEKLVISQDVNDPKRIAWGVWNHSIYEDGWNKLHIHGIEGTESTKMTFCAGAIEGYLAHDAIYNHSLLIREIKGFEGKSGYPEDMEKYLEANLKFVKDSIDAYQDVQYWKSINLVFQQFEGLVAGFDYYDDEHGQEHLMTELDHWVLQSEGDLGDTSHALEFSQSTGGPTRYEAGDPESLGDHCTGLIKLVDGYKDIYIAHDAWSAYQDLHGVLKEYHLPCPEFKAHRITMSTRAGKLSSYDDYYIMDNGLLVIETTMSIFNMDLYKNVHPKTLYTWLRAVHACWTASSGQDWTEIFIRFNSGTYNNQYLIVDSNKFVVGQKPTTDLLWCIEQYPAKYMSADITEQLVRDTFFPSVNKPHWRELFEYAGYPEKIAEVGEFKDLFYQYEKSARYLLIAREHHRLNDFENFKEFMRYNNWERDLYSNGDPSQMIMSRYDQRPEGCAFGAAKAFGGLDSKCMKLTEAVSTMRFHAIASPTTDHGLPVWEFDKEKWPATSNYGLPDVWNFSWITFQSDDYNRCAGLKQDECSSKYLCGFCTYTQKCYPGNKEGPFVDQCEAGWKVTTPLQNWAIPLIAVTCVIVVLFAAYVYGSWYFVMRKK